MTTPSRRAPDRRRRHAAERSLRFEPCEPRLPLDGAGLAMTELFSDAELTQSSGGGFVFNLAPFDVTASLHGTFAALDASGRGTSVLVNGEGWTWIGSGVDRFADGDADAALDADEIFATLAPDQGVLDLERLLPPEPLPALPPVHDNGNGERPRPQAVAFEPIDLATLLGGTPGANPADAPTNPSPTQPLDGVVRFASHRLLLGAGAAAPTVSATEAAALSRGWALEVATVIPGAAEAPPASHPVEQVRPADNESHADLSAEPVEERGEATPAADASAMRESPSAAKSTHDPAGDGHAAAAIDEALVVEPAADDPETAWVAWTQPRCALAATTLAVLALERMRDRPAEAETRVGPDVRRTPPRRG